jgi:hypothetical protein
MVEYARGGNQENVIEELSLAYHHILYEFADSGRSKLRLLPVSGGVFSGKFGPFMPRITVEALGKGFAMLEDELKTRILNAETLELCIYMARDFEAYVGAVVSGRRHHSEAGGRPFLAQRWRQPQL